MRAVLSLSLLVPLLGAACDGADEETVAVFAAASLIEAFVELAEAYERSGPDRRVELQFGGSATLATQIVNGASADVFAAADRTTMARVVETGRANAPVAFATNRLTIATAPGNPKRISGLEGLARDDLRVVLCGPDVPAGRYAREALGSANVDVRSMSDEPSVRAIIAKIALGEVDAGIVYVTDAAASKAVDSVPIPQAQNAPASYEVATIDGALGSPFTAFLASPEAQAILQRHGFGIP
ncbi:MAG: molybdate ABC transporter substrate-binding protein [Planctomycetota bacterium]